MGKDVLCKFHDRSYCFDGKYVNMVWDIANCYLNGKTPSMMISNGGILFLDVENHLDFIDKMKNDKTIAELCAEVDYTENIIQLDDSVIRRHAIRSKLDDMFETLYGDASDEYNQKFSERYESECSNICEEIDNRIITLQKNGLPIDEEIVSSLLVIGEQEHIGNDLNIDKVGLKYLSNDIINGYTI